MKIYLASNKDLNLRSKYRFGESLIQGFLFLCGAISILVTIGIVFELGKEALLFFTTTQWEEPNKETITAMDRVDTSLLTTTSGTDILPQTIIRIEEEEMLVLTANGARLSVLRGLNGTTISDHSEGKEILTARKITLVDFFTKTQICYTRPSE